MPLPLRPALRVIEIGCGPGAAPREVARPCLTRRARPGCRPVCESHPRAPQCRRSHRERSAERSHGCLRRPRARSRREALRPGVRSAGRRVRWTHPTVGERALAQIAHALGSGGHSSSMGGTHYGRSPSPHLRRPPTNAGTAPRCLMVCGVIGCRPPTVSPSTRGSMLPVHRTVDTGHPGYLCGADRGSHAIYP